MIAGFNLGLLCESPLFCGNPCGKKYHGSPAWSLSRALNLKSYKPLHMPSFQVLVLLRSAAPNLNLKLRTYRAFRTPFFPKSCGFRVYKPNLHERNLPQTAQSLNLFLILGFCAHSVWRPIPSIWRLFKILVPKMAIVVGSLFG